jgi:hypothetical protein
MCQAEIVMCQVFPKETQTQKKDSERMTWMNAELLDRS